MRNEKEIFQTYKTLKVSLYMFINANQYQDDFRNLKKIYLKLDSCVSEFTKLRSTMIDYRNPRRQYTLGELKDVAYEPVMRLGKLQLRIEDFIGYSDETNETSVYTPDDNRVINQQDLIVLIRLLQQLQSYVWSRFIEKFEESIIY